MDGYGIAICIGGLIAYFATQKKYPFWLFLSGVGLGILIGAVWANMIVQGLLR